MFEKSKEAIEMYHQAGYVVQEGKPILAEPYSIQSRALFEETGETSGVQYLNAANALNALTFLRWSQKDYEGALASANESVRIMETYDTQFTSSADVDFIYNTARELVDQMQYEMSLYSKS